MNKVLVTVALISTLSLGCFTHAIAQQSAGKQPFSLSGLQEQKHFNAKNGMTATPKNYKTFTPAFKDAGKETIDNNKGYENHPEIGRLYAETPCDNCYELIGKRTETTKTYVKKGSETSDGGKDIYQQTSTHSMHYRDAADNWRTIQTQLHPGNRNGVYSATEQPSPVVISAVDKHTVIGKSGESFSFNNNLELVYAKPDGTQTSLGNANWTNHTAGDDGIYVTNVWPGIDMEMYVARGTVKTNFYINHAMPEYASGKLLVRDHFQLDKGLSLFSGNMKTIAGNLAIQNRSGSNVYEISAATACEKNDIKKTLQVLDYYINGNTVDIALPGNFLNRAASAYPVMIDPLVSTPTVTAVTGSTYSATISVPCVYNNAATVPANCTITDIQWSFNYITSGGAYLS